MVLGMETTTFNVKGMTCEHCVAAVTQELSALPGVHDVRVDLGSGEVAVQSEAPLADEAVRAAVDEAGYEVVS
jgi:copper ion binding protein